MMKWLQKLGKALMLPVACLPICGILMGIGYLMCPATMQGGEISGLVPTIGLFLVKAGGALIDNMALLFAGILMGIGYLMCPATMQGGEISGLVPTIGLFLVKAGGALIDNMALLFAIGVGVGMSDDHDGTAGLAALASWLMITTLLSEGVVTVIRPGVAENTTQLLAFQKIANPFIGILAGVIGATCYNKFKNTRLPNWLAFFSGKRSVAMVAGVVSIVVSAVLLFVWPLIFGGLVAVGKGIANMGALGAGIYAFLNRLLIPTGLHHALNNVFWFDTIGLGDLTHFWAGETSADVTWSLGMYMSGFFPCMMFGIPGAALAMIHTAKSNKKKVAIGLVASADVTWSLGMYMSGFFPCMMFGIPGAALAMIHTAKSNKKKVAIGLVASAAVCAFICGVTEPFEFGFMFLAPVLYVIYALLYGIFAFITVALGFRAGFSFSAGATDLLFSASLPAAAKTWLIIPLGIAAFIVFYVVFRFAIVKFDLKTPGREDDDEDETKAVLANNDLFLQTMTSQQLQKQSLRALAVHRT